MVFLAASDISSLSYQLLFTSAKLFFLFVFYIGFQILVVSWARLFYSEGVFGVVITTEHVHVSKIENIKYILLAIIKICLCETIAQAVG